MRVYFDSRGRVRGYSARPLEAYGLLWLWWLLLPIAAIVYYLPCAIWRSRLGPWAKLLIIGGMWGLLIAFAEGTEHHTAARASAAGCIDVNAVPSWYVAPTTGTATAKCASLPGLYVPRQGCTIATLDDPASGSGGCSQDEKPRTVGGGPLRNVTPRPTLSIGAQTVACRGHDGPETGPDFPPPVYIGPDSLSPPPHPYFIVSCMDGTSTGVPAR